MCTIHFFALKRRPNGCVKLPKVEYAHQHRSALSIDSRSVVFEFAIYRVCVT